MSFTVAVPLPLYAGAAAVTIRVTAPGSPTRVNGGADDAMADTASDGLFVATIAEDLVGTYTYLIYRSGTAIQSGWFRRVADQAAVVLDDERDFRTAADDVIAETAQTAAIAAGVSGAGSQEEELTIQVAGNPVDGAAVWVTTDESGLNVIAGTLYSNGLGKVRFMLDPTGEDEYYYVWCQKNKVTFTNPTQIQVEAE